MTVPLPLRDRRCRPGTFGGPPAPQPPSNHQFWNPPPDEPDIITALQTQLPQAHLEQSGIWFGEIHDALAAMGFNVGLAYGPDRLSCVLQVRDQADSDTTAGVELNELPLALLAQELLSVLGVIQAAKAAAARGEAAQHQAVS